MAKEKDLDVVLNHLGGMYFQSSGKQRPDLAAINTLVQSPSVSFTPNSPREPFVISQSARLNHPQVSVPLELGRKNSPNRHATPVMTQEFSHVSAVTIELDESLYPTLKQGTPRGSMLNTTKSKTHESHRPTSQKSSNPVSISPRGTFKSSVLNWSSAPWTIQSRARHELLDDMFREDTHLDSKPVRKVSPTARKNRSAEKQTGTLPNTRFQKPDFASAMIMIQAVSAQQELISDARALAAENVQSLAVLLKYSASAMGLPFCTALFEGIFQSMYHADTQSCKVMQEFSNWIADANSEGGSISSLTCLLKGLTSFSERVEIVADMMFEQNRMNSEMSKKFEAQQDQIRQLHDDLALSKKMQEDAELNLLATVSRLNASMVGGDMSDGFVSNLLFQDSIRTSEQLRDDLKECKALLLTEQSCVADKSNAIDLYKKTVQEHEESLHAMNQTLNDSQMAISLRDLQIETLRKEYSEEYNRNPINPSSDVELIMNSSTWVSKLVRSEDLFDFSSRPTDMKTHKNFSQRDQCLGLLISWINKHLAGAESDIHVSNFERDMSSGVILVHLFRRCMGNDPYYQRKCDAASVAMDTDSRLVHVAEMASTLLHCDISVGSIISSDPKTIWMIVSELFNTNPTLDPSSIANLKVLSSDAIHVVRRQSLGIILSESFQSTSSAAMFSSMKESTREVSKVKQLLPELPHESMYAHMNPNLVIFTLNGLTPRWALHKIPIQSLLESLSKSGGNGCLALCISIFHRHRSQLSDVFRYYSLLGRDSATSLPSMDIGEVEIFLGDAQIDLDLPSAEEILKTACRECYPDVVQSNDDYALDLVSFLSFLLRVALESGTVFETKDEDTEYIVATNLTRLVQNHICCRAIRLVKCPIYVFMC
jgi:hypothetical protein